MANQTSLKLQAEHAPNSTLAVVSLVAGILGVTLFPFIGSIVAVITGIMGRREIDYSGGTIGGEGLATAGMILGWVGIGVQVVGLCLLGLFLGVPLCFIPIIVEQGSGSFIPLLLAAL